MCHRSQAKTFVFIKRNIEDNYPTTITNLNICLEQTLNENLVEGLVCFGSSLCRTRSFQKKSRNELTNIIAQLGYPTLFFTQNGMIYMQSCFATFPLMQVGNNNGELKILSPIVIQHLYTCTIGSQYFMKRSWSNTSIQKTIGTGFFSSTSIDNIIYYYYSI